MSSIKALQTHYDGYHFRSRTEARWAVFFNTLGVAYEYEKEGYDLGGGLYYLPDFWLPDLKCWIEIKGKNASEGEKIKATLLAEGTGHIVYIFQSCGPIDWKGKNFRNAGLYFPPGGGWDGGMEFGICPRGGVRWKCGKPTIGYSGDPNSDGGVQSCSCDPTSGYDEDPRLEAAYKAARSARFGT